MTISCCLLPRRKDAPWRSVGLPGDGAQRLPRHEAGNLCDKRQKGKTAAPTKASGPRPSRDERHRPARQVSGAHRFKTVNALGARDPPVVGKDFKGPIVQEQPQASDASVLNDVMRRDVSRPLKA